MYKTATVFVLRSFISHLQDDVVLRHPRDKELRQEGCQGVVGKHVHPADALREVERRQVVERPEHLCKACESEREYERRTRFWHGSLTFAAVGPGGRGMYLARTIFVVDFPVQTRLLGQHPVVPEAADASPSNMPPGRTYMLPQD